MLFVSIRFFVPILGIFFFLSVNQAHGSSFPDEKFENSWLKIYPAGELESKPHERSPYQFLLSNVPQGKVQRSSPNECSSLELEREMVGGNKKNPQAESKILQNFLTRCEKPLTKFNPGKYQALLSLANGKYPLEGRSYLKELVFTLPYNIKVHGLLALKDSDRPRPLVVFNCGTACDLSSPIARLFLAEIFDETPFNVLVLPSLSGNDFIKDNLGFGLGGFEEGRLTFEIIHLLGGQDSPFVQYISSFHILGVSLGGNGSLFTGVYATYNNSLLRGPKIQSVTAYCPVVDLRSSLADLDRNDTTGRYFTDIIKETIVKNFALVFKSSHELPDLYKPGHNQTIPFIEKYILPTYQAYSKLPNFNIPPFTQFDFNSGDAFWKANNYLNYYSTVTVPTLLFYSKDDFIVMPKHNSQKLESELEIAPSSAVNVVHVEKGSHCAAMEIYGEDIITGAMQNFILNHSPEFNFESQKQTIAMQNLPGANQIKLLFSQEKFLGYRWKAKKGSNQADLNIEVWAPYKDVNSNYKCDQENPYYAFEGCFRQIDIKVPLKQFFPKIDSPVSSDGQAQALTRWLNVRAKVLKTDGYEPIDSIEGPDHMQWIND